MEEKMENVSSTWETHDFYSAAILRSSGIPLLRLIREKGKFVIFRFSASPAACEEILKKHWDRTLKVETRLLIETINELRTRMYEELKGAKSDSHK